MATEHDERERLYHLQDETVEHKFPHNVILFPDEMLSCAGDIYREIAGRNWPAPSYLSEKLWRLDKNIINNPYGIEDFWWTVREEKKMPRAWARGRDDFLATLKNLYHATEIAQISFDRKAAMLAALKLEIAMVYWYESGSSSDFITVKQRYAELKHLTRPFMSYRVK